MTIGHAMTWLLYNVIYVGVCQDFGSAISLSVRSVDLSWPNGCLHRWHRLGAATTCMNQEHQDRQCFRGRRQNSFFA